MLEVWYYNHIHKRLQPHCHTIHSKIPFGLTCIQVISVVWCLSFTVVSLLYSDSHHGYKTNLRKDNKKILYMKDIPYESNYMIYTIFKLHTIMKLRFDTAIKCQLIYALLHYFLNAWRIWVSTLVNSVSCNMIKSSYFCIISSIGQSIYSKWNVLFKWLSSFTFLNFISVKNVL